MTTERRTATTTEHSVAVYRIKSLIAQTEGEITEAEAMKIQNQTDQEIAAHLEASQ